VEVVRELVLEASTEEVWDALTAPERLEEWFANEVELDLERGEGVFRWDDGEERRAEVADAEPGRRLSLRWWDESAPDATLTEVTFTLVAVPAGTRLVVREAPVGPVACAGEWVWALELRIGAVALVAA
jgi:uncharacterized protein YndB with AHSA1/START domain